MEKVAVLSIDQHLKNRIEKMTGSSALLHSSFNRTVNYLSEGGMFTFANESLDNAVSTIRLSRNDFKELFDRPAKEIYFTKKGIEIDNHRLVDWSRAKEWTGKKLEFPAKKDLNTMNLKIAKAYLIKEKKPSWANQESMSKENIGQRFEEEMEKMLNKESEKVFAALAAEPINQKILDETHLFGLGRGLTPSGDDLINGIVFVAALSNFPIDLKEQSKRWNKIAKEKTNLISSTAIYQSSGSEIAWGMIKTIEIAYQKIQNHKEEENVYKSEN